VPPADLDADAVGLAREGDGLAGRGGGGQRCEGHE
jgi:hypothetical protein